MDGIVINLSRNFYLVFVCVTFTDELLELHPLIIELSLEDE